MGLDPDNVNLLTDELIKLKEQDKIILIASHLLNNLDLDADRVLFLKKGHIALESHNTKQDEELYLKVRISEENLVSLFTEEQRPAGARHIANALFCLPLKDMNADEVGKWTSFFYEKGYTETKIGKIGSSEWYNELYTN
ncbi:MAG: hypothetical protein U5K84_09020 [Alkalibacterium sp.]|nr:hypothetical protein [Alkalibacterium sp.]